MLRQQDLRQFGYYSLDNVVGQLFLDPDCRYYLQLPHASVPLNVKVLEQMEGVRLTVDLLERCGFTSLMPGWLSLILDNVCFSWASGKGVAVNEGGIFNEQIEYLHQLQSLYTAHTGQELQISTLQPA